MTHREHLSKTSISSQSLHTRVHDRVETAFTISGIRNKEWVEVYDGGACYFSGKYDPDKKLVYDLTVNGVA